MWGVLGDVGVFGNVGVIGRWSGIGRLEGQWEIEGFWEMRGVLGDGRGMGDVGCIGKCEGYLEMLGILGDVRGIGRCEGHWEIWRILGDIDNTDWVGNRSRCIHLGGLFAEAQSRDLFPRLGLCKQAPEMDTVIEDFYPVCIVFISPPAVELCILSLYCACFVRVLLCICVVYRLYILYTQHLFRTTRQETHAGCQCSDHRS